MASFDPVAREDLGKKVNAPEQEVKLAIKQGERDIEGIKKAIGSIREKSKKEGASKASKQEAAAKQKNMKARVEAENGTKGSTKKKSPK